MRYFRINFGPDDKTVDGKPMELAKKDRLAQYKDSCVERGIDPEKISSEGIERVINSVASQQANEKAILVAVVENTRKFVKNLSGLNKMMDLTRQIEDADTHVVLTTEDLQTIKKSIEKMDTIPAMMLRYRDLLRQLESPEDITEKVNAIEKEPEDYKEE